MKRTTIWLPEDLADRLTVESARTGVKTAELIRRAVEAATPPLIGELRKRQDRIGFLSVFVHEVRDGQLLVEVGDGIEGHFKSMAQLWVDANWVKFPDLDVKTANPIPEPLISRGESAAESMRLNLNIGTPPFPNDPEDPND